MEALYPSCTSWISRFFLLSRILLFQTRNPLTSGQRSPRGSLSKYSPRSSNNNNNANYTPSSAYDTPDKYKTGTSNFEQLPIASDEEYGLETEDL